MTAVRDLIAETADSLARQQARVDVRLTRALSGEGWRARLSLDRRALLESSGHFPAYAAELDWTPRDVAGHLRDSALVFTERIYRLRTETEPVLADFRPTDTDRVAGYAAASAVELVEGLRAAQAALVRSVAGVRPEELGRTGVHETDGPVALADVLAFLPGHQRDHADQLEALLDR